MMQNWMYVLAVAVIVVGVVYLVMKRRRRT